MKKHGPTDDEIVALADAMCAVLNDTSDGNSICDYVKAKARVAMEPFLLEDYGELPDLEWAQKTITDSDRAISGLTAIVDRHQLKG